MKSPTVNRKSARRSQAIPKSSLGILILGMHRSGTSALTRTLNLLGCALPDMLVGPSEGNELGHWESASAVTLNDEILASSGSSWDDWGPINDDWKSSGLRSGTLERIKNLITDHAALGPLFVLKDPRLCRSADLWLEGMDATGVEARVILMLRHPNEVAASLEHRDLMNPNYAQLLWLRYVLDSERFSRGRPRVICCYDQLLHDWRTVIASIRSTLNLSLPRNSPATGAEIDTFLTNDQRHHNANQESNLSSFGGTTWLKRTFDILSEWVENGESDKDYGELDNINHEFESAYAALAPILLPLGLSGKLATGTRLRRELDKQIAEAKGQVEQAKGMAREVERLQDREVELANKSAQLEATVNSLQLELREAQAEAQTERERRAEAEGQASEGLAALSAEKLRSSDFVAQIGESENVVAQHREELAQLQAKLRATENALADAEDNASQERDLRLRSERLLEASTADLNQQNLKNAELSGRLSATESNLAQRREELAQLEVRVREAEKKSLTEADLAASRERELRLKYKKEIDAFRHRLLMKDNKIAEYRLNLNNMQLKSEKDAEIMSQQKSEKENLLDIIKQKSDYLDSQIEEISIFTKLLIKSEEGARDVISKLDLLRDFSALDEQLPKWWLLMPSSWRQKRKHRLYQRAGLFDAEKYLQVNPDVAESGMDPIRHYIFHGIFEGRTNGI